MNKSWVGYLAVVFLCLAGVFEWIGGYKNLGIFLIALSVVSLFIRIYINKKLGGRDKNM
jgi:hypothetical protein